jgi:hypothetical protein
MRRSSQGSTGLDTGDVMTKAPQVSRNRSAHVTAMARDQNAHNSMISQRPASTPTGFTAVRSLLTNIDHGSGPSPRSELANIRGHFSDLAPIS